MFENRNNGGNNNAPASRTITKEIKQVYGELSVNDKSGWKKVVAAIAWNGGADKLDIREWDANMMKCSKGISLTEPEAYKLYTILHSIFGGGGR